MKQETYRRIVSGKDQRVLARMFRILLAAAGLLYGLIVSVRNRLYDKGLLNSTSVDVPVICIGNITTGGTGKTPLVIWLCNYLTSKGIKCAILTRGYKTEPGQMSDEPALLENACECVRVVVNSDRVEGAREAIEKHGAQVLIMDDGFQHRRLTRDMDILAIDATCPFGYGHLLPAGLLREPIRSLARAAAMILTRTDQVDAEQIHSIEQTIQEFAPAATIAKTSHKHTHATGPNNRTIDLETLRNKKVYAFCGIGNPEAFFESLSQSGLHVAETRTFDDHHAYSKADIESILERSQHCNAEVILCTQKDWIKCEPLLPKENESAFASLAMELDFIAGYDIITQQLDTLLKTKGKTLQ